MTFTRMIPQLGERRITGLSVVTYLTLGDLADLSFNFGNLP